jgi:hypothetical protein
VLILGFCSWRDLGAFVFHHASAETNPLAYCHTSDDILNLPKTVARLQRESKRPLRIGVIAADPWPLPWYLRNYEQVGYWRPGSRLPDTDIVILDQSEAERLDLEKVGWRPSIFGQRPGALLLLYEKTGGIEQ